MIKIVHSATNSMATDSMTTSKFYHQALRSKLQAKQAGIAVIFSVLLVGFLLTIVFTLSAVFIPKIRLSAEIKSSVTALYAAESAMEWCLYVNRQGGTSAPVMINGATYTYSPVSCAFSPLKTAGSFQGVTRWLEVAF